MVTRHDIQATCDAIVREFAPLQVILFGSYAYGTPTESSDVDLLVVMPVPKSETSRHATEISRRIRPHFSLDVLVHSPEDMAYRLSYNDWFLREITEKGEVLYKSANFFMAPPKKEKNTMNPLTLEWVEKAEEDYAIILLIQREQKPMYNSICFHAQQCAEKYLKAWLQEADIPTPRTHDLNELPQLIVPTLPISHQWKSDLSALAKQAVAVRYPGDSATADKAAHATHICNEVRQTIRESLKLSPINED